MKTVVYIDGYNLYYGRLRSCGYKWIDVYKLVEAICKIQDPNSEILKVKYFTSPVLGRFATHGNESNTSQRTYHNALKQIYADKIEIINGFYTVERRTPAVYSKPINLEDRVEVWGFEEKQTDVNIAMYMFRDALKGECEQQVLVSSDSDLEPALKFIAEDCPQISIGLIMPKPKPRENIRVRPVNEKLNKYSNWTREYILDDECEKSLLPDKIPTKKKCIIKPVYW